MHPATPRGFGNHVFDDLTKHLNQRLHKAVEDFTSRVQYMECSTKESTMAAVIASALEIAGIAATVGGMSHKSFIQLAHETFNRYQEQKP
jgi:hypothetical protein